MNTAIPAPRRKTTTAAAPAITGMCDFDFSAPDSDGDAAGLLVLFALLVDDALDEEGSGFTGGMVVSGVGSFDL
jgi:hypothetical protein